MEEILLHVEDMLVAEVGIVSCIEFDLPAQSRDLAADVSTIGVISGVAVITSLEKELSVYVESLVATVQLPCLRCDKIADVLLEGVKTGERQFFMRIPSELLSEDFPEVFRINRSEATIDIGEMLRQEILLALPSQYQCSGVHVDGQEDVDDGHNPFAGLKEMLG